MSVILFFIDGLGIGSETPSNPFYDLPGAAILRFFQDREADVPYGGLLARTDPRMGVEGRPQSASGQTTILTGINAPAVLGYHKQGFPNEALRQIIRHHSIFLQLKKIEHISTVFANAYPPQFFEVRPRWVSATTNAVEAAGLSFLDFEHLLQQRALFQDYSNRALIARGFPAREIEPEEAGHILADLGSRHDFTLYEYFITDKIGHNQDMEAARRELPRLCRFVESVLKRIDLSTCTLIITSDHGNIEDLSTRNHTLNDVPTLVWGKHSEKINTSVKTLSDITPAIVNIFTNGQSNKNGQD
jgi:2,3-bisphosphoglycerate-independent phosphoglycerate mutase